MDGTSVDRPDASDLLPCRARETGSVSTRNLLVLGVIMFLLQLLFVRTGEPLLVVGSFAYLPQAASTARCF